MRLRAVNWPLRAKSVIVLFKLLQCSRLEFTSFPQSRTRDRYHRPTTTISNTQQPLPLFFIPWKLDNKNVKHGHQQPNDCLHGRADEVGKAKQDCDIGNAVDRSRTASTRSDKTDKPSVNSRTRRDRQPWEARLTSDDWLPQHTSEF